MSFKYEEAYQSGERGKGARRNRPCESTSYERAYCSSQRRVEDELTAIVSVEKPIHELFGQVD
jgi:hypothetical protein